MSKKAADLTPAASTGSGFTTTKRGPATVRHASASARLAREAQQQRVAYLALFGVIGVIVLALAIGAVWDYVIYPAQSVATVNGVGIRNDVFNRYQKLEALLLSNQQNQYQAELAKLQSDPKSAAANQQIIQQLTQQQQLAQTNAQNIPAYTLSQMEQALMLTQAATKLGVAPTSAQLDAQISTVRKQAGPSGFAQILSAGVTTDDLRTYFAAPAIVQTNVQKKLQGTVSPTQPEAQARHILLATKDKVLAQQLFAQVRANNGATFGVLAKRYSIDNGLGATSTLTGTAKLTAEQQSSAFNGGWLRDPSTPGLPSQPGWLSGQTQFVKPVLDAILSMKPGEVRLVQSQFGWHIIQVTRTQTLRLTKAQIQTRLQQQGQTAYQTWAQNAVTPSKNKINPSDPYTQFPTSSQTGQ